MNPAGGKIGIALSGGGARGIAHVGALQALEENGISPGYVSGVSFGAIVGVLYAAGLPPPQILEIFKTTRQYQIFRPALAGRGLMDLSRLKGALRPHLPEDDFGALQRRLFVCVANLTAGRYEIMDSGDVLDWVVASASIPLVFKPRRLRGQVYGDGGVLNNLPVEPLRRRCQTVIGVNVTPIHPDLRLEGVRQLLSRTIDLAMWNTVESRLGRCDVVIEPPAQGFGFFEANKADQLFELGYRAALPQVKEIQERVGAAPPEKEN